MRFTSRCAVAQPMLDSPASESSCEHLPQQLQLFVARPLSAYYATADRRYKPRLARIGGRAKMNTDQQLWADAKRIFDRLVRLPTERWQARLDRLAPSPLLRDYVLRLFA